MNGVAANIRSLEEGMAPPCNPISSDELERKRIARELHDGLGQLLTSMNLKVQECLSACTGELAETRTLPRDANEALLSVSSLIKQAMGEVRSLCTSLRPSILDDLGVLAAVSWQCRQISHNVSGGRLQVRTNFGVDESMIPELYKTAIYRIVQESLNNAVKYSRADRLVVSLQREGHSLKLSVQDNGTGFDWAPSRESQGLGMGINGMRERAESLGGTFELCSSAGRGVRIEARFPLSG